MSQRTSASDAGAEELESLDPDLEHSGLITTGNSPQRSSRPAAVRHYTRADAWLQVQTWVRSRQFPWILLALLLLWHVLSGLRTVTPPPKPVWHPKVKDASSCEDSSIPAEFIAPRPLVAELSVIPPVDAGPALSLSQPSGSVHSSTDLLVPLAQCPFGNIDLLLIVIPRDRPMVLHLLRSLDEFMPCYGFLHLITDDADMARSLRSWIPLHARVRFHLMDVPPGMQHLPGYFLQCWKANWSDRIIAATPESQAKYVMWLDPDVVFTMPVTCRSLFDEWGRPYLAYWTFDGGVQPQFEQACSEQITGGGFALGEGEDWTDEEAEERGIKPGGCIGSFMATFPVLYPIDMFPPLRAHIAKRLGMLLGEDWGGRLAVYDPSSSGSGSDSEAPLPPTRFDEAFTAWSVSFLRRHPPPRHVYSQFVILGNFLALFRPQDIRAIYLPQREELDANLVLAAEGSSAESAAAVEAKVSSSSPANDPHWLARNYLPVAQHYGWRYCFYLGSCVTEPWPTDAAAVSSAFAGFSPKYSPGVVELIEEVVHKGWCVQEALRRTGGTSSIRGGGDRSRVDVVPSRGSVDPMPSLCACTSLHDVHAEAKTYQHLRANLSFIAERYRPEILPSTLPGQCPTRSKHDEPKRGPPSRAPPRTRKEEEKD